jgi:hypothetical protein
MIYIKLQKVLSKKTKKNFVLFAILKVTDENSRIRIRISNPDPLVRVTDPRFRISNKMSRFAILAAE